MYVRMGGFQGPNVMGSDYAEREGLGKKSEGGEDRQGQEAETERERGV